MEKPDSERRITLTDALRLKLRERMIARNESQGDLARQLGVSQAAVSTFLLGKNILREEPLNKAAALVREEPPPYPMPEVKLVECLDCGESTPLYLNGHRLNFCAICGTQLGSVCERCGELNLSKAQFCMSCGAPLGEQKPQTKAEQIQARRAASRDRDKKQGAPEL